MNSIPVLAQNSPPKAVPQKSLQRFEHAVAAYQAGDYTKAFTEARILAMQGHAQAQTLTGYLMERGLVGTTDPEGAAQWYRKAAQHGDGDALMGLARLALDNKAGLKAADAGAYLEHAAQQGHEEAYLEIAELYEQGLGVKPSPQKAAYWVLQGAQAGDIQAQKRLAFYYMNGKGVPEDTKEAAHWFARAAEQGDPEAAYAAGVLYADDENNVAANPQKAQAFFKQAAKAGDAAAATGLGLMLYQGRNTAPSPEDAIGWFKRAAQGGDAEGCFLYAYLLAKKGKDTKNIQEAYYWLSRAEDMSSTTASQKERDAWFREDPAYQNARKRLRQALEARLSPQTRAALGELAITDQASALKNRAKKTIKPALASSRWP